MNDEDVTNLCLEPNHPEGIHRHGHARYKRLSLAPALPSGASGPPCIWCNAPTRRTGACFTCIACGATTSC